MGRERVDAETKQLILDSIDDGMSAAWASKKYNVPAGTIGAWINRRKAAPEKPGAIARTIARDCKDASDPSDYPQQDEEPILARRLKAAVKRGAITPSQALAVSMRAAGATYHAIAQTLQKDGEETTRDTVSEWMRHHPVCRKILADDQRDSNAEILDGMRALRPAALTRLGDIIESGDDADAARVAFGIFDRTGLPKATQIELGGEVTVRPLTALEPGSLMAELRRALEAEGLTREAVEAELAAAGGQLGIFG